MIGEYKKVWYAVDKGEENYWFGFILCQRQMEESEIIKETQVYCKEKGFKLVILIEMAPFIPIVNQIYPESPTEESAAVLDGLLSMIYGE